MLFSSPMLLMHFKVNRRVEKVKWSPLTTWQLWCGEQYWSIPSAWSAIIWLNFHLIDSSICVEQSPDSTQRPLSWQLLKVAPLVFHIPRSVRWQFLPPAESKCEQVAAKANYVVCGVSTCRPHRALLGVIRCFVNSLFLWLWWQFYSAQWRQRRNKQCLLNS